MIVKTDNFKINGGHGGNRTHTGLLPTVFETAASAYSATRPVRLYQNINITTIVRVSSVIILRNGKLPLLKILRIVQL